MKKLFFLTLIGSLFLVSCTSDEPLSSPIDASTVKIPVTINVTSNNEFNELRSASPNEAGIIRLLYIVYNNTSGDYIKHKSLTEDLTSVKDTLPTGTYRIALVATTYDDNGFDKGFDDESFPGANINFKLASLRLWPNSNPNTDIFYKDIVLDVKETVQKSIALERITSKIEIIPQDLEKLPADVSTITFFVKNSNTQTFYFADSRSFTNFTPSEDYGAPYIILDREELLSTNEENPIILKLLPLQSRLEDLGENNQPQIYPITMRKGGQTWDGNNITLKSEYTLERNKILRLKGNLFTSETSNGVSIDDEWDADVTEDFFD